MRQVRPEVAGLVEGVSIEIRVPHKILYQVDKPVPIADVIASLLATEQLMRNVAPLLEECFPGVHVEKIELSVGEISEGSLKEILYTALFLSIQKDLEKQVPAAIEYLTGHKVTGYESIVTLIFCVVLFYGADFIYSQVNRGAFSKRIRKHLKDAIKELSGESGISEERISQILEKAYGKSRIRVLAQSAINFFQPSKNANNAPILISDDRKIARATVADVPSEAQIEEAEVPQLVQQFENVQIEIHAQDVDRTKSGWAAVVPKVTQKRLKMELAPPLKPSDVYLKQHIRGDVMVILQKRSDGSYQPTTVHLMHIRK